MNKIFIIIIIYICTRGANVSIHQLCYCTTCLVTVYSYDLTGTSEKMDKVLFNTQYHGPFDTRLVKNFELIFAPQLRWSVKTINSYCTKHKSFKCVMFQPNINKNATNVT